MAGYSIRIVSSKEEVTPFTAGSLGEMVLVIPMGYSKKSRVYHWYGLKGEKTLGADETPPEIKDLTSSEEYGTEELTSLKQLKRLAKAHRKMVAETLFERAKQGLSDAYDVVDEKPFAFERPTVFIDKVKGEAWLYLPKYQFIPHPLGAPANLERDMLDRIKDDWEHPGRAGQTAWEEATLLGGQRLFVDGRSPCPEGFDNHSPNFMYFTPVEKERGPGYFRFYFWKPGPSTQEPGKVEHVDLFLPQGGQESPETVLKMLEGTMRSVDTTSKPRLRGLWSELIDIWKDLKEMDPQAFQDFEELPNYDSDWLNSSIWRYPGFGPAGLEVKEQSFIPNTLANKLGFLANQKASLANYRDQGIRRFQPPDGTHSQVVEECGITFSPLLCEASQKEDIMTHGGFRLWPDGKGNLTLALKYDFPNPDTGESPFYKTMTVDCTAGMEKDKFKINLQRAQQELLLGPLSSSPDSPCPVFTVGEWPGAQILNEREPESPVIIHKQDPEWIQVGFRLSENLRIVDETPGFYIQISSLIPSSGEAIGADYIENKVRQLISKSHRIQRYRYVQLDRAFPGRAVYSQPIHGNPYSDELLYENADPFNVVSTEEGFKLWIPSVSQEMEFSGTAAEVIPKIQAVVAKEVTLPWLKKAKVGAGVRILDSVAELSTSSMPADDEVVLRVAPDNKVFADVKRGSDTLSIKVFPKSELYVQDVAASVNTIQDWCQQTRVMEKALDVPVYPTNRHAKPEEANMWIDYPPGGDPEICMAVANQLGSAYVHRIAVKDTATAAILEQVEILKSRYLAVYELQKEIPESDPLSLLITVPLSPSPGTRENLAMKTPGLVLIPSLDFASIEVCQADSRTIPPPEAPKGELPLIYTRTIHMPERVTRKELLETVREIAKEFALFNSVELDPKGLLIVSSANPAKIPDEPEDVELSELLDLFEGLNWEKPNGKGYRNPATLTDDSQLPKSKQEFKDALQKVVKVASKEKGADYMPADPAERDKQVDEVRIRLKAIVKKLKEENDPEKTASNLISIAKAGFHCWSRYLDEARQAYNFTHDSWSEMMASGDTLEQQVFSLSDNLKQGVVEERVNQLNSEHPQHLKNHMAKFLEESGVVQFQEGFWVEPVSPKGERFLLHSSLY